MPLKKKILLLKPPYLDGKRVIFSIFGGPNSFILFSLSLFQFQPGFNLVQNIHIKLLFKKTSIFWDGSWWILQNS